MTRRFRIDLHMHTIASTHAYSTIQEYVQQAKQKNLQMIAITDHGQALGDSPHRWHFINLRVVPRMIDGVAILRGIEANILNIDGEIDCDPGMYRELDLVIAGFHEPAMAPMDLQSNTQAMINTIKNPMVNIISHPGNPNFPIDYQAVAEAAKQHHVALEINNSSFISRRGSEANCRQVALAVKKCGGMISLGSDSHFAHSVGEFDRCLALLDEIDFPEANIINRSPQQLLQFLAIKHGKTFPEFAELS